MHLRAVGTPPATLIDSCVLLDLFTEDPVWEPWSSKVVEQAGDEGRLVINPIVYAEVSVRFGAIEELDDVLAPEDFDREALPYEAAFLAGKAFAEYRSRGGQKASPLPDFYIGAHAAVRRYRLITRDAQRYRSYFPGLQLIAPE
jgi:predicted nucleic acid-binding protein